VARSVNHPQGTRVACVDRRGGRHLAMLTGHQETRSQGAVYLELIREGSANGVPEFWPAGDVTPLPKRQQLVALGGNFKAPKGYPYVTRERP
jgi:hypothetical protein